VSTYTTAEAALLTLVRAYNSGATFTPANSSVDDWRVLDASSTTVAAVLEMAAPTIERTVTATEYGAYGEYQEVHQIGVWICAARGQGAGGDGAAKAACKTLTEAVKDYLRPYRRLNAAAGVRSAAILRTTDPAYISPTRDIAQATHVAQEIIFEIACESDAPEGEIDG
jgi:hypothetical protein